MRTISFGLLVAMSTMMATISITRCTMICKAPANTAVFSLSNFHGWLIVYLIFEKPEAREDERYTCITMPQMNLVIMVEA